MDNKQKLLAGGAAALLATGVAVSLWFYSKRVVAKPSEQEEPLIEVPVVEVPVVEESKTEEPVVEDPNWPGFEDPNFSENRYLSKIEASSRGQLVSDVNYLLTLGLMKGG